MSATKEQLQKIVRPLAIKWATRGVLWVLTAKLGLDALEAETASGEIGNALGAVACVVVSLLIDWWHHRQDLAQTPPEKAK